MKNLLVLTAVSAILVASGSAMADGQSSRGSSNLQTTIGTVTIATPATGLSVSGTNGSTAVGLGTSGQTANLGVSATSGVLQTNSQLSQVGASTATAGALGATTGSTNSGTSSLNQASQLNGTNVSASSMNVANIGAGNTTTQGMANTGSSMVGGVASALPSSAGSVAPSATAIAAPVAHASSPSH
jgi:hypothetical protein